jgi:hypothetical protein
MGAAASLEFSICWDLDIRIGDLNNSKKGHGTQE